MARAVIRRRYSDDDTGPNVLPWVFAVVIVLLVLGGAFWLLRSSALFAPQPTDIEIETPSVPGQGGQDGGGSRGGTPGGGEPGDGEPPSLPAT